MCEDTRQPGQEGKQTTVTLHTPAPSSLPQKHLNVSMALQVLF